MHICMLISKLVPFRDGVFIGGSISPMVRLSQTLAKAGHTLSIVAGSPEPEKEVAIRKALSWANVCFVPAKGLSPIKRGIRTLPGMLLRAVQVCRRNSCDLIHSHSGYPHWAGLAAMAGLIARRPVVHTLYCPLAQTVNDKRHPLMNASCARLSLSAVDRIVAISSNVRCSLTAAGIGPHRIAVIPPPLDNHRFNQQTDGVIMRQLLGLGSEEHIVLFVGNLTRTKGLDILLRAMQGLLATHPRLRLVYTVERGPAITDERERVIRELITNLGICDRIVELGIVNDMPTLMAASDVLVVPYRSTDGPSDYSVAMLEAMAIGRPVVATRVGANPEIISDGQTGVLVAEDDASDLARGIASILNNPSEAKVMGDAGSRIVREKFDPFKIAQAIEKLYLDVLRKKSTKNENSTEDK